MANEITYQANGQEIKLSPNIVQQFITKGNGNITSQEAFNFIQLCRYQELNPFLNEAYLIKFGNQPAQMVTSKEAILKRAARQKDYQGMTSGLVVVDKDGNVNHKKGQILYPNETLLGAWAEVYREDFKEPVYSEVAFEEYDTGKSTWSKMPANMINKVAQAKALREAYPEQMGSMYLEEEPTFNNPIDVTPSEVEGLEEVVPFDEQIKIKEEWIKNNHPTIKTLKGVKELVSERAGVDYNNLNAMAIYTKLLEIEKEIEGMQIQAEKEVESKCKR